MFRILIVLLVGIVLGFALRRVPHIRQVETSAHYTICDGRMPAFHPEQYG